MGREVAIATKMNKVKQGFQIKAEYMKSVRYSYLLTNKPKMSSLGKTKGSGEKYVHRNSQVDWIRVLTWARPFLTLNGAKKHRK